MQRKIIYGVLLATYLLNSAALADEIVQEGEILEYGEVEILLDQFDDMDGAYQLDFVQIDLYSSMHGGFTTSGSGTPVFISITYRQDYYHEAQSLAGTQCHFQDTLPNIASGAYSFWIQDEDQVVIDDAEGMAPWIGKDTITVTSIGDFSWYADPPEDILDCGAGLVAEYTFTYGYTVLSPCPADVTDDGTVDVLDLLAMLSAWGPCPDCPEDINGDGVVDVLDLLEVLSAWGPCP